MTRQGVNGQALSVVGIMMIVMGIITVTGF